MHVYGWPITAKVASYDWNRRRTINRHHIRGEQAETNRGREVWKVKEGVTKGVDRVQVTQDGHSYADAVKKIRPLRTEDDKNCSMTWSTSNAVYEWSSRSAIGVLRNFSPIEMVNQKLEDRGFVFSSTVMGGKNIIWTFENPCDRDGFVNNSFFWRECFSSMKAWSSQEQMVNSSKMRWVDVHGVPVSCWCKEFFKKLGGTVGEMVWIDEETELRQRMDIGKMLILAPVEQELSKEVAVNVGKRCFPVKMVEQATPVTIGWLSNHLSIRPAGLNLNYWSEKVESGQDVVRSRREGSSDVEVRSVRDRVGEEDFVSVFDRDKKDFKKVGRNTALKNPRQDREGVGGNKADMGKGKSCWFPRSNPIARVPVYNGNLRIQSQRRWNLGRRGDGLDSSNSSFENEIGPLPYHKMCIGECSKGPVGRHEVSGPRPGSNGIGSIGVNDEVTGIQGCRKAFGQSGGSNETWKKANLRSESSVSEREEESEYEESLSSFGSRDPVSIQVVPETQLEPDRGIDLMVDLRNQGERGENQIPEKEVMTVEELSGLVRENQQQEVASQDSDGRCQSGELKKKLSKSSRGKQKTSSIKSHPMITRGLKVNSDKGYKGGFKLALV
ncbi:hypothetical protein Q3G72_013153 [Acer saccharum]|nr:hypothetical protein Q3G72_013153 [Acer saccharum]